MENSVSKIKKKKIALQRVCWRRITSLSMKYFTHLYVLGPSVYPLLVCSVYWISITLALVLYWQLVTHIVQWANWRNIVFNPQSRNRILALGLVLSSFVMYGRLPISQIDYKIVLKYWCLYWRACNKKKFNFFHF